MNTCKDCMYWRPREDEQEMGEEWHYLGTCHRYPPTANGLHHPATTEDDWCGEFQSKKGFPQ